MHECIDRWTGGWMYWWADSCKNVLISGQMHGCTYWWVNSCFEVLMGGQLMDISWWVDRLWIHWWGYVGGMVAERNVYPNWTSYRTQWLTGTLWRLVLFREVTDEASSGTARLSWDSASRETTLTPLSTLIIDCRFIFVSVAMTTCFCHSSIAQASRKSWKEAHNRTIAQGWFKWFRHENWGTSLRRCQLSTVSK